MKPTTLLRALRLALSVVGVPIVCLILGRPVWPAWALALGAPLVQSVWAGAALIAICVPPEGMTWTGEENKARIEALPKMKRPWIGWAFSLAWWIGLVLALGWGRLPC